MAQTAFSCFIASASGARARARWIGRERKRGKLEALNSLLMAQRGAGIGYQIAEGEQNAENSTLPTPRYPLPGIQCLVGDAAALQNTRYVTTLDADTQLPREAGRRLVETIAHPLNAPRLASDRRSVERGYTLIQPRVSTSLPSATASRFTRLFTDPTGTDPYTHAVSDVYQDLAGEGSYIGKGIYDLAVFHSVLEGRFPDAHLLSHDLIEGAHTRVGYASDIELFDSFPTRYAVAARRQHRWIRGDWQIADWLLPRVPTGTGQKIANPLTPLNRWKIADNLRRSLVPAVSIALALCVWLLAPVPGMATALLALMLFLPSALQLLTRLTTWGKPDRRAWRELDAGIVRAVFALSLLPHQAWIGSDAIGRVAFRPLCVQKEIAGMGKRRTNRIAKCRNGGGRFFAACSGYRQAR